MLLGFSLETFYLVVLFIIGCCTIFYLLFADLANGAVESIPFLDPAVLLSSITFTAAAGYVAEKFTSFTSLICLITAIMIGISVSLLIYYFLLLPLRITEIPPASTDALLEGQTAKIIVPVPLDGYGEILIKTVNGIIVKRAASFHHTKIPYDTTVLIVEVRDNTAYVAVYD